MKKAPTRMLSAVTVARSPVARDLRAGLLGIGPALAPAARAEGGKGVSIGTRFAASARAQGKVDRMHRFGPATRASGK